MAITFSLKTRIKFNGKEYGSTDEMPADVRQTYERIMVTIKDPSHAQGTGVSVKTLSTSKIIFNGTEYAGVDHMPPGIRETYERVMASVDSNRNGLPDVLEGQNATAPHLTGQKTSGVRSPLNLGATGRSTPGAPRAIGAVIGILVLIIVVLLILLARKNS